MTTFNKSMFAELRKDIEAALAEVEKKYGIEAKTGKIKYDESNCTIELKMNVEGGDSAELAALKRNLNILGFTDKIVNAEVTYSDKKFKVTGFKGYKKVLITSLEDNKVYQVNYDQLHRSLALQGRMELLG